MSELDQLRRLLFGHRAAELDRVIERVERPERRSADVAEVLADSIDSAHRDGGLDRSLKEPLASSIAALVRERPAAVAELLYPVIGPTVRKSVAEALKSLAESIDHAVETSLTPRGLRWRFEAARAGVPFGEYLLHKSFVYRVEHVYLLARGSGLLVEHAQAPDAVGRDEDAVAAMFTAIQDFMNDSFAREGGERALEIADMGEFRLLAANSPHAALVAVVRGVPPPGLRTRLIGVLEDIQGRYDRALAAYSGERGSLPGVAAELDRCLAFAERAEDDAGGRRVPWALLLLIIVLALLGFWLTGGWLAERRFESFREALAATPGYVLTDARREGGQYRLRGLRDPLAVPLERVAAEQGVAPGSLVASWSPYQSLETPLVEQRLQSALTPPESVEMSYSDGHLRLSGTAPSAWIERAVSLAPAFAGVAELDVSGLSAPADPRPAELEALADDLTGTRIYFGDGIELEEGQAAALAALSRRLLELDALAAALGRDYSIEVAGRVDPSGTAALNRELSRRRAERARAALVGAGVDAGRLRVSGIEDPPAGGEPDAERRHARLRVTLAPPRE